MLSYILEEASKGSGLKIIDTVGGTITKYNVLYVNSSGVWMKANATSGVKMPCSGIACESITNGLKGTILTLGLIQSNEWAWTPGAVIYVSTTDGALTQTAPNTPGNKVQIAGRALTANLMLFNPDFYASTVS